MTADELLDALSAIRRALRHGASRPTELAGLTGSQLELVRVVRRNPGVSVADAAAALRVAPNTVSTLVRELTGRRVLVRKVDVDDRRVARLELAPGMRRRVEAWRDRRTVALDAALGSLSKGERAKLEDALSALEKLAERLQ